MATPTVIVDRSDFRRVGAILRREADSRRLAIGLGGKFRVIAEPIIAQQKTRVSNIPSRGLVREGGSIRAAIQDSLMVRTRLTGYGAGVIIRAATTPNIRRFRMAPRRFNQRKPFRHRLFGQDRWYNQTGDGGWFSEPALHGIPAFRAGCKTELDAMARRIAARHGGA